METHVYINPPFKGSLEDCEPSGRGRGTRTPPPTCSKPEEGAEHKPRHILSVFINAAPNLQKHRPALTHNAALSLPASHDPRGGLLEDIAVSCCEAVATYVCSTWFPGGTV